MKAAARPAGRPGGRPGRGRARRGPAADRPGHARDARPNAGGGAARGGPTPRGIGADPAEGGPGNAGGPGPTPERAGRRGAVERGKQPRTRAGRRRVASRRMPAEGGRRGAGGPQPTPERAGGGARVAPQPPPAPPRGPLTGRGLREGFSRHMQKSLFFGSERQSFLEGARGQETLAQQGFSHARHKTPPSEPGDRGGGGGCETNTRAAQRRP